MSDEPRQIWIDIANITDQVWYKNEESYTAKYTRSDLVDELVKASNEVIDNWYSDNSAVYNRFVDAIAAIEQGDGV